MSIPTSTGDSDMVQCVLWKQNLLRDSVVGLLQYRDSEESQNMDPLDNQELYWHCQSSNNTPRWFR